MSDVDKIVVEAVDEHDDGSASFTVKLDEGVSDSLASEGLKLVLYCAAAKMDLQLVYDFIEKHIRHEKDDLTEYKWGHYISKADPK